MLLGAIAPAFKAQATTVVALSDDNLTSMASHIVHGVIESVEPVHVSDAVILTRVSLRVKTWLKSDGDTPETFEFYTRGGTIGEITQTIPGDMQPVTGTEVVVFLERIPRFNNVPMLLGLLQGAFFVEQPNMSTSDLQKQRRVAQKLGELHIHRAIGTPDSDFARAQSLGELLDKIRSRISDGGKP